MDLLPQMGKKVMMLVEQILKNFYTAGYTYYFHAVVFLKFPIVYNMLRH